ncbi:hypothetical protein [Stigmatella aurantiaca]|uniref:Porin n=1 Tax=Stigmatella aurantiaca (strain DW4/3-1) TaxID=378806 RepID=Q08V65_STIAD|nr:hypothetical protein [Stigmatella aurantiaca]ADO74973.1 uncharacterized protein STAUR_7217 [Stigmatella aurantiaca DW4/3-1]EAU64365.1 conserved hypothetical protein [Stigmatella aurantiaca DW4/3-1]
MLPVHTVLWCRVGLWLLPLWMLHAAPALAQDDTPPATDEQAQASAPPTAPGDPAADPAPKSPEKSLEELLQEEVAPASVGSFGYRLRRYGITPYVHGVITTDLWQWERRRGNVPHHNSFELRDANLYFGADIFDLIVPEVFLEFEPSFTSYEFNTGIRLRYAQLDLRIHKELLVLRAGLFLVPFGTYNTVTLPAFINKLPERPTVFREVIPSPWQEVGVQLTGSWQWAPGRALSYAVFITNGMEQFNGNNPLDPNDDGVDEGGSIAFFTPSYADIHNTTKSFGARLSAELAEGLSVGASGYTGAYTYDGARRLSLVGADATFVRGPLTLELEAALAHQQIQGGALDKWGYAAVASYRVNAQFEPLVALDQAKIGTLPAPFDGQSFAENGHSYWGGFIFLPFPEQIPTALTKAVYRITFPSQDKPTQHVFTLQLTVGF